jgi:hypothetical protein
VVGEGELRWIVARAVQLEERSRLEDGYAAQQALLQVRLLDRDTGRGCEGSITRVKVLSTEHLLG